MPLDRHLAGTNDDGSPHYLYVVPDGAEHVVATGAATGTVETKDGTVYDVTPHYVEVKSAKHAAEVVALIDGKVS